MWRYLIHFTDRSGALQQSSADQSVLDVTLPGYFGSGFSICFSLLGTLFVMCQTSWPILFVVLPLAYLYFLYQVSSIYPHVNFLSEEVDEQSKQKARD